jgi:pilus assembly protein Flp/PilA
MMMNLMMRLWKDEEGQGMVEYGLILALVSIAVITVLGLMGTNLNTIFTQIKNAIVPPAGG